MRSFDDRGQIYTIEGFASALILVGVLFFIFQSISVVTPQTEMSADMKLGQKAADTLICMDRINEDFNSDLKAGIAMWNGHAANYFSHVYPGEASVRALDAKIVGMLSNDTSYNVEIAYYDGSAERVIPIIIHGLPSDNSVVATRLITLNENDTVSPFWSGMGRYPQLIEVRLICWYL